VNSTLTGPVANYLAKIRAELSDLPPGELEDVLDDVTGHLTDVAAEFDGEPTAAALENRLGTPLQYADELRTAAGYPPKVQEGETATNGKAALRLGLIAATVGPFFLLIGMLNHRRDDSDLFCMLVGLVIIGGFGYLGIRALSGHDPRLVAETAPGEQWAASIRGLLGQLPQNARRDLKAIGQPLWWVGRGIVAGGGISAVVGLRNIPLVLVVGALVGALVSIWIGRRTQQDRRWLWFIVPLNVVATIAVPVWLAASLAGYSSYRYFATNYSTAGTAYTAGLSYDGSEVQNVYPFDEQGRPLTGVRLYTETGTPLELTPNDCASQYDKAVSGNVFPQMTIVGDSGATNPEDCQESDKPGFKVLPPLAATTTAPTSPTPSSPATPSPGAGKPVTPTAKPSSTPSAPQATATEPEVTLTIRPLR
jgi:hypothetical protein